MKDLENQMKKLTGLVVDDMGTSCTATCAGKNVVYAVTYHPVYRTGINKDDLKRLEDNHPSIYNEYVKTTESRRFQVKRKELA